MSWYSDGERPSKWYLERSGDGDFEDDLEFMDEEEDEWSDRN